MLKNFTNANCNGQQQQKPATTGRGLKWKRTTAIKNTFRANITWKLIYEDNHGIDYIDLINKSVHGMHSNLIDYQQEHRAC